MSGTLAVQSHGIAGTSDDLQRVVDAAARGGGTVELPAGTFLMYDSLHLRSGLRLQGNQNHTVLRKAPTVASPLEHYVGYGHFEFAVREPEKFRPGMGVILRDDNAGGFYQTQATITERRGEWFFITSPAAHDYLPMHGGMVENLFPLVAGHGVTDATIENVVLEGHADEAPILNGCRGAGVYLLRSRNVMIDRVVIRHFRGDGISFQQCADVFVRNSLVQRCTGGGIHPGSGSVRYVIEGNRVEDNGGCGIFYCLRTTHSICRNNVLQRNAETGISIGERDTDHLIIGNTIVGHGKWGVEFREVLRQSGDRVRLGGNAIGPNNTKGEREHEVYVHAGLSDVDITGNAILIGRGKAVFVGEGCRNVYVHGNKVERRLQTAADVVGPAVLSKPAAFPPLDPGELPSNGATHLGFGELPTWHPPEQLPKGDMR